MTGQSSINWREQIEATITGQKPDRIPAIFRLDKWYKARQHANDWPEELAGMRIEDVERYLGLSRSARDARVYDVVLRPPVERACLRENDLVITEWRTGGRTLRKVARYGPGDEAAGLVPATIEFPIKGWDDYGAYIEVMRHTEFVSAYDDYARYDRMIGLAGLPLVIVGCIPFHDLLQGWTGYEKGYLDLCDRPDIFLDAVAEGNTAYRRMWEIVARSPAKLVMHGVNFDRQLTPPPMFREHFLPYLKPFNREMHLAGKKVAFHGDGDMTGLLDLMLEADFGVADCFACRPLVPCTVREARRAWKDRITIWGGLPSTLMEPRVPLDQLRDHLACLYRDVAPGDRFMLAISDQAMPTTGWQHLSLVGRWVRDHAGYPIG